MKSLYESLFDKDLMGKSSPVEPEVFWDMIFKDAYCKLRNKCIDRGWLMDLNNDGLKVYKAFYGTEKLDLKVIVKLQFNNGLCGYPQCPQLVFNHQYGAWDLNFSDGNAVRRWLTKKDPKHFNFVEGYSDKRFDRQSFDLHFECTTDTVRSIIKLMKSMIDNITSEKYVNLIQSEFDKFININKHVPGVAIDQAIMKKLIKDS
jgi:hypothetical protein